MAMRMALSPGSSQQHLTYLWQVGHSTYNGPCDDGTVWTEKAGHIVHVPILSNF